MNVEPPFRVQIRKVDRDEFTAYRWGEIENGDIVKRYDAGEEHFGPFEDVVEWSTDLFADGADPADPAHWLRQWHNYGSQAQHPRADVVHPYLDRHLWGEDGIVLTGALRGLVAPDSYVETVNTLHIGATGAPVDGTPLVVRYEIGELPEGTDLRSASEIERVVHPTVVNIIQETLDVYHGLYVEDYIDFDRFVISAVYGNTPHARVELPYQDACAIDWESYDAAQLREDAVVYYNASD